MRFGAHHTRALQSGTPTYTPNKMFRRAPEDASNLTRLVLRVYDPPCEGLRINLCQAQPLGHTGPVSRIRLAEMPDLAAGDILWHALHFRRNRIQQALALILGH